MNKGTLKTFGVTLGAVLAAGLVLNWFNDIEIVKNARDGFGG